MKTCKVTFTVTYDETVIDHPEEWEWNEVLETSETPHCKFSDWSFDPPRGSRMIVIPIENHE